MLTRREIFVCAAAFAGTPAMMDGWLRIPPAVSPAFPSHDPALAREMVGVSHGNVARVRELLDAHPALAKAAWDWGYGDWETALGAASHMGNRDIAELLLARGAGPTIFSAAMLGELEAVKAFVAARPSITRTRGPHGITLMAHAKAGGPAAQQVVAFLTERGDADIPYTNEALSEQDIKALVGTVRIWIIGFRGPRRDLRTRRALCCACGWRGAQVVPPGWTRVSPRRRGGRQDYAQWIRRASDAAPCGRRPAESGGSAERMIQSSGRRP